MNYNRGNQQQGNPNQTSDGTMHNSLAEEAFLGHLLTEPVETFDNENVSLTPEDFYDPRNQLIFEVALNLHENYDSVNIVSIVAELNKAGRLHEAGGIPYLKEIVNPAKVTSFGTNPVGLSVLIQEAKTRRDLYSHSLDVAASVSNGSGLTAEEAVVEAEESILNIVSSNDKSNSTTFTVDNIADSIISDIRALSDSPEGSTPGGIPTGFDKLDYMTSGFKPGQLIIIAARPGVGKALCVNTPILTEDGFVKMGDLKPKQHKVLGRDNNYYPVLATHEPFVSENSYRVTTDNGGSIIADSEHIWVVAEASKHAKQVDANVLQALKSVALYIEPNEQSGVPEISFTLLELFKDESYIPFLDSVLNRVPEEGFLEYYTNDIDIQTLSLTKKIASKKANNSILKVAFDDEELESGLIKANKIRTLTITALSNNNGEGETIASPIFNTLTVLKKIISEIEQSTLPLAEERTTEQIHNDLKAGLSLLIPNVGEGSGSARITSVEKLTEPYRVRCITVGSPDGTFTAGEQLTVTHNSTIAVDFARNASFLAGKTVAFFSLEMSESELTTRIISAESRVESQKLKHGNLDDNDWMNIIEAREKLRHGTFIIDVNTAANISYIRSVANKMKMRPEGLDMLIIDYLQLLEMKSYESRQQAVSDTSRALKLLAKDLKIPIIVLSQLNRKSEERTGGRPMISDLRESGSLEQDADIVLLLHRPEMSTPDERPGETDLIVAKQRGGETGVVPLTSMLQYSKFVPGTGMIEIIEEEVESLGITNDGDADQPW